MFSNESLIQEQVRQALLEDIGSGDVSAELIPADFQATARIISREPMTVCGVAWVNFSFLLIDPHVQIHWDVTDGDHLAEPATLCHIQGNARAILTAERTALNFLQTLSATATQTQAFTKQLSAFKTKLLDTRKTIPGLRLAQKYAVTCGGGLNHRLGLYDAYLIKENHIRASGSLSQAIQEARKQNPNLLIEVEVETIDELKEALAAKPGRILLDNFSEEALKEAVRLTNNQIPLEASGNVTLETLTSIAKTGVDYISTGQITKSIQAIDLSLLILEVTHA